MKTNKNNLVLSFSVVLICITFQLCFFENQALASFDPISRSPAIGATGVAIDSNLVITFNDNWKAIPSNSGFYIQIKDSNNNVFATYNFPAYPANITGEGTPSLTINPSSDLAPQTNYTVVFYYETLYGESNPTFTYPDPSTIDSTWNFTTGGCYNPPTCIGPCIAEDPEILHKSPPDGGHFMQSYEGINMILDQVVTVGVGNIVIRKYSDDSAVETIDVTSNKVTGWGTTSITINPSVNLANNTHYYINLDLTGYATAADKDEWDFWTKSTPNTFAGSGL